MSEDSYAKETSSLDGLIRYLETIFECRDGPYQAWVEHEGDRLWYVTLGIRDFETYSSPETLRNQLLHSLLTIRGDILAPKTLNLMKKMKLLSKDDRPILYWRFAKGGRIQEDVEKMDRRKFRFIRTRVAIPGANWDLIKTAITYNPERDR